jgi:hypothetical protein
VRGSLSFEQRIATTKGITSKVRSQKLVPVTEFSFAVCWRPVLFQIQQALGVVAPINDLHSYKVGARDLRAFINIDLGREEDRKTAGEDR